MGKGFLVYNNSTIGGMYIVLGEARVKKILTFSKAFIFGNDLVMIQSVPSSIKYHDN